MIKTIFLKYLIVCGIIISSHLIIANDYFTKDGPRTLREIETLNRYNNQEGIGLITSLRRIPYVEEGYIPQSIHVKDNSLFLGMYHKDEQGKKYKPSIVTQYSLKTNSIKKTYELYQKSGLMSFKHLGGLVIHGDYIIIPAGENIYFYNMKEATKTGELTYRAQYSHKVKMDFSASSFVSRVSALTYSKDHNGDGVIWVSEWKKKNNDVENLGNHILGYPITENATVSSKPKYKFFVPKNIFGIQGITVLKSSFNEYVFALSSSMGSSASNIYKLSYIYEKSYHFKYRLVESTDVFTGPYGIQGTFGTKKGLWTMFEAGANWFNYRTKEETGYSPWIDDFPFIIRINKEDL